MKPNNNAKSSARIKLSKTFFNIAKKQLGLKRFEKESVSIARIRSCPISATERKRFAGLEPAPKCGCSLRKSHLDREALE
jgi:hypothetical protein